MFRNCTGSTATTTTMDGSKEKTDQTAYAAEKIAEAEQNYERSKSIDDPGVLELLLGAEKKCRLSNDSLAAKAVVEKVVTLLRDLKEWDRLDEMLTMLAKRRSQSKAVISAMLGLGIEAIQDQALETREKLLTTLSAITEGRMYCELERAKISAEIKFKFRYSAT